MDLTQRRVMKDRSDVAAVFGDDTGGLDAEAASRLSSRLFVRDETHIASWASEDPGETLTAFESLQAFGWNTLSRLADRTATGFLSSGCEVAPLLRARRELFGLSALDVAERCALDEEAVTSAEGGVAVIPIAALVRLAQALALED